MAKKIQIQSAKEKREINLEAPKGRQFDALLQSPLSENRLEEFGKTRESAVAAEKFNIHYQSSGDEEDKKARMQE